MFGRVYLAELKKQAKPKLLIIFGIIGLALIAITTLITAFLGNVLGDLTTNITLDPEVEAGEIGIIDVASLEGMDEFDGYDVEELLKTTESYSRAECEILLAQYSKELTAAKQEAKSDLYAYYSGFGASLLSGGNDYVYSARAQYSKIKYIVDNEYYDKEFVVYGDSLYYSGSYDELSMEDILTTVATAFAAVSEVFAIVIGAYSITTELKSGTMKLMLLRPVSREKFLGAKMLAGYTLVVAFQTLGYAISAIVAAAIASPTNATIMFIFNSTDVYMGSASLAMFYNYIFSMVTVTAYYALAFGLGTMLKNTVAAIILPLVATMGETLFSVAAIGRYWFTDVISWGSFFGSGSGLLGGSHFAIAFLMTTAYMILLCGGALLVFHKRDVA